MECDRVAAKIARLSRKRQLTISRQINHDDPILSDRITTKIARLSRRTKLLISRQIDHDDQLFKNQLTQIEEEANHLLTCVAREKQLHYRTNIQNYTNQNEAVFKPPTSEGVQTHEFVPEGDGIVMHGDVSKVTMTFNNNINPEADANQTEAIVMPLTSDGDNVHANDSEAPTLANNNVVPTSKGVQTHEFVPEGDRIVMHGGVSEVTITLNNNITLQSDANQTEVIVMPFTSEGSHVHEDISDAPRSTNNNVVLPQGHTVTRYPNFADLHPYSSKWNIKARLVRLLCVTNRTGGQMIFRMLFVDEQGDAMEGSTYYEAVDYFKEHLDEGKVYCFRGVGITLADQKYKLVPGYYKMCFTDDTTVASILDRDDNIPINWQHITRLSTIS